MAASHRPVFLFARHPDLDREWPFVPERLTAGLDRLGEVRSVVAPWDAPLASLADLSEVAGIAWFGGRFTKECVQAAPLLRVVGCNTDNSGHGLPLDMLFARDIPVIDTTRAWGQSVAECALGLALGFLRHIPHWHARMAAREPLWAFPYAQYCDDPDFVGGDLGARRVGVMGLGQIGGRIARFCVALGSDVVAFDPYVPEARFAEVGARRVDMDTLVAHSEVLFVAVPPTPSARGLLSAERIDRLGRGSLVVVVTRAHAVDMAALRRRIVADELAGAFDVYDVEPLPPDDALRGRRNVVHTPHIAGRTRDANLRTADILVQDFERVLGGQGPQHRLSPHAIAVRTGKA